jgi:glutamate racemase
VFHDADDLRHRVELPILGVVTRLVTEADRARQRVDLIRFASGVGGLIVLFAVALTILAVQLSRQVA